MATLKDKLTKAVADEAEVSPEEAAAAETKVKKTEDEFKRLFDGILAGKNFSPYTLIPEKKLAKNTSVEPNVLYRGLNIQGVPMVLVRIKDEYL